MKILIVGAGIGGLGLAAFLNNSHIEYDVIDKADSWANQGYALAFWNNGRNMLKKLQLSDVFDVKGKSIKNYYIFNGKGKILRKYCLSSFYSNFGMALSLIDRSVLHGWLLEKIDQKCLVMGLRVKEIKSEQGKNKVTFSDGSVGYYDLVVGADGIKSEVRDLVFKDFKMQKSKYRVWYAWVDNAYKTKSSVAEYIEAGNFFSLFDDGDKTLAIMIAENHNVAWDESQGRITRLAKTFKNHAALVPQIFDSLQDDQIVPGDLFEINLSTWIHENVVLMGDAAHGFGPWAGLGGSMALEDGYVLAGELLRVNDGYSLASALNTYEIKRKKRVHLAQRLTHKMKAWAFIKSKTIRKIFNVFIPYFPESYLIKDYSALLREEI